MLVAQALDDCDLDGAVEALTLEVRQNPTDSGRRAGLAELLCFAGDLERADRLLDLVQHQDPSRAIGVALFRQLIRAEEARQQFYREGRLPEFIEPPDEHDRLYLQAAVALRLGDAPGAAALLADAENRRQPLSGVADGDVFDEFRDLDDLAATHLDVLTSTGKFYWLPWRRIESVVLHRPERRRDLLWRRATIATTLGTDGEVFVPTIYPGTATPAEKGALRLGRETAFAGTDGAPVLGRGLRSFLVGDSVRTVLELSRIEFVGAGHG